jgi:hypothetical protein
MIKKLLNKKSRSNSKKTKKDDFNFKNLKERKCILKNLLCNRVCENCGMQTLNEYIADPIDYTIFIKCNDDYSKKKFKTCKKWVSKK